MDDKITTKLSMKTAINVHYYLYTQENKAEIETPYLKTLNLPSPSSQGLRELISKSYIRPQKAMHL